MWESCKVTPFAGVWIEILDHMDMEVFYDVTPFAGVWIEIDSLLQRMEDLMSLPSRECGLKL